MFDTVSIAVTFISGIEAVSLTGIVSRGVAINENHHVHDAMVLAEFPEKLAITMFLVISSCLYRDSFDSGSLAAYSQYCSSLRRITVSLIVP
jgi:hypothetical protein